MVISPLFLVAALVTTASADCYSHDGIKALDSKYYTGPELVSCGNGTANCCLEGQKCGTNLLCADGGGGVTRQYCANPSFNDCSDMCPGTPIPIYYGGEKTRLISVQEPMLQA